LEILSALGYDEGECRALIDGKVVLQG
jgi:hypothetical protein